MTESTYEDPSVRNAIAAVTAATVTTGKCTRRWVAEIALCPDCRRPAGDHDNLPNPSSRWVDAGGGTWEEHPADPTRIRFMHDADGKSPTYADYWTKAAVTAQFGELTPEGVTSATDLGMTVTTARGPRHVKRGDRMWHVMTAQTGTVRDVGPNALDIKIDDDIRGTWSGASWFWELLPAEDTGASTDEAVEVYLDGKLVRSEPETVEQRKIREAADALEDIIVMAKRVMTDLRDNSRVTGRNAADPVRAIHDSYGRVFTLRRKLSRVVAALGSGTPSRLGAYEEQLDRLVRD